jgi:hypothetical protein
MKKVWIYAPLAGTGDQEDIKEILSDALCVIVGTGPGLPQDEQIDLVIVILTPDLESDPNLEIIIAEATRRGCEVLGIWPKSSEAGALPEPLKNYADSILAWGAQAICGHIGTDGAREFQQSDGSREKYKQTDRNPC